MLRRIAGLLVILFMAHLDIARAYAACAREDTHRAADHQQMTHDHASMTSTPTAPANDSNPVPSQAECCRAMASCVTSVAFGTETASSIPALARVAVAPSVIGAPSSLIFAPDPPPPRV